MSQPSLDKLKRKRTTQRSNITRFIKQINDFNNTAALDDIEHSLERLQDSFQSLIVLDDAIHELIENDDYSEDVQVCENYIDSAKRAMRKASKLITAKNSQDAHACSATTTIPIVAPEVKLPTIRIETFSGDIESWPRFWEQFQASVDKNSHVSVINKHVFLRGYLDGEPKHLVDGISVTADTYDQVKKILESRYGDKNRIIQSHLDFLDHLQPAHSDSPEVLNVTYIECHRRIQALTALGEDVDVYGKLLAPKILRAFPEDLCRRWLLHAKRLEIPESSISRLMQFLNEEVECALTTQKIRNDWSLTTTYTPTAATLHVNSRPNKPNRKNMKQVTEPYCVFCENRGHWGQDCQEITNHQQRSEKLKTANRCFLCLRRGHHSKDCAKKNKVSCSKCKGSHHVSICERDQREAVAVGKIDVTTPNFTYLQTARVWITGPTGLTKLTRCILDAGSQSSFIRTSLVDQLKLTVVEKRELSVTAFECVQRTTTTRRVVQFNISGVWTKTNIMMTAFESENKYSSHPAVPHDIYSLSRARRLQLADPKDDAGDLPIELLIGGDHYWKVIKDDQFIRLSESIVLLPSNFGWVLSGNKSGITVHHVAINHIHTDQEFEPKDDSMRQFWDLETLGIREQQGRTLSKRDATILQEFHDSFRMEEGRRVVSLPRKEEVILPSNRVNAKNRFRSLERKLHDNAEFREMYYSQMIDYIEKGHVEISTAEDNLNDVFYLPHHAVKKERNGVIKWRIVFDASSHERDSPSLNDALEAGPNLLPEILSTLVRFRTYQKAIVGDGTQAFLQLYLDEKDRDLTRFFWYRVQKMEDGNWLTADEIVTYRFTRLPFGLTCSPFLLSATLRELASRCSNTFPTAAELLDQSTFMDDFVAGADDDNGAVSLYYEVSSMFRQIRLPMDKWATNSETLKNVWQSERRDIKQETSVLGIKWNTELDCLVFDHREITEKLARVPATKRQILQRIARFYDPLGLFSPVSIVGKLIFQDTWCRGIEWDEILPQDIALKWQLWISSISQLSLINVPRWIGMSNQISNVTHIHVFCDASERAYGAALYTRTVTNDNVSIHLACSKSRLSPVKRITLPRLELLATLIGSRLLKYFCQSTGLDNTQATLWTDSMVALGWIRSDPNRWKTFVCNRVTEIQNYLTPVQYRYCPSEDNPADLLTRGMLATDLNSSSLWWNGPQWLAKTPTSWPREVPRQEVSLPESKKATPQVLVISARESLVDISRYSSYWKLIHITCWILRFVEVTRRRAQYPKHLTTTEIEAARLYWIRRVQEECFSAEFAALTRKELVPTTSKIARFHPLLEDNLIRLGGRLQFADLSENERNPLLLDGSHHFTKLLIKETHVRLHHMGLRVVLSELRREFWILKARQVIKKVIYSCLPCKIIHAKRCEQIEAPLPMDRVKFQRPFTVCGVDFAGPLFVKFGAAEKRCYIVLFTCATTRAIHLELATDLSTDKFLLAFQRFVGRRGLPNTMYSDNARTFHAASREISELQKLLEDSRVQTHMSHNRITWKFIVPRAAWWGGFWERMVGSTKMCLKKVLGRTQVNEEELSTVLVGIEATLNSRPITVDDSNSDILTPSHFLIGERLTSLSSTPEPSVNQDITKMYKQRQKLIEHFEQRWKKEYLLQLRSYHEVKQAKKETELRIGDVVLVHEDLKPRLAWKRGRICELRRGRDDRIRTVVLQLPDRSKITRPIQLVVPLEIDRPGWGGC